MNIFKFLGKKIFIFIGFFIFILFLIVMKIFSLTSNFEAENTLKEIGTDQTLTGTKSCVSYKIRFPYFKNKQVDEVVHDEIYGQIENYIEEMKKSNSQKSNPNCSISSDYKTFGFDNNCGVSIFIKYLKNNGKKTQTDIKTYVFHNGKNIKLEQIIDPSKMKDLIKIIKKRLLSNKWIFNMLDKLKINLDDKFSSIGNNIKYFGITDDEFIVYFEAGDILPEKYGVLPVEIKNVVLKDIFSKDFYKYEGELKSKKEDLKEDLKDSSDNVAPAVALTFDDGPKEGTTDVIIDELNKEKAKATFFVVGLNVEEFPDLIKKAAESGHEIANHTYSHKSLTRLNKEKITDQIEKTNDLVENILGFRPKIVRPPGGAVNKKIFSLVDYPLINWSVDTKDWKIKNSDDTVSKVLKFAEDGDIVLMHDIVPSTAKAVKTIISGLKEKGFKLVTVSELFRLKNIELEKGKQYFSAHENLNVKENLKTAS